MKAIILAAGQSKRLQPLTNEIPKCLLGIGTETIIDHQIKALMANNITQVVVVTGFKAEILTNHLISRYPELTFNFIYNDKYESTYPAYGLWMAREYLNEPVIYLNADLLCDAQIYTALLAQHGSVTAIKRTPWDEEEVNVIMGPDTTVTEIGKHITEQANCGEFIGATTITPEFGQKLKQALEYFVETGQHKKFAADALNYTIRELGGTLNTLDVSEYLALEIDTIEDYEHAFHVWAEYEKFVKTTNV